MEWQYCHEDCCFHKINIITLVSNIWIWMPTGWAIYSNEFFREAGVLSSSSFQELIFWLNQPKNLCGTWQQCLYTRGRYSRYCRSLYQQTCTPPPTPPPTPQVKGEGEGWKGVWERVDLPQASCILHTYLLEYTRSKFYQWYSKSRRLRPPPSFGDKNKQSFRP